MDTSFASDLKKSMGEMTQEELARRSGVSQASISRILAGIAEPGLSKYESLVRVLPRLAELRNKRLAESAIGGAV